MRWVKLRWFLAAVCLLISWKLMAAGLKIEGFGAAGHVVFAMAAFLSSIFLMAPETAFRIAEWCARPVANILFPSEEFSKPPLSYRLARRYRDERRLGDAIEQYEKIIRHHPRERDAYVELLEIAEALDDARLQRKYGTLLRKRFPQTAQATPPVP